MKNPKAIALLFCSLILTGCVGLFNDPVAAPNGSYVETFPFAGLNDYTQAQLERFTQELDASAHLSDWQSISDESRNNNLAMMFQVSQDTLINSGVFEKVNGLNSHLTEEKAGNKALRITPVLVYYSTSRAIPKVIVCYTFRDTTSGEDLGTALVTGTGGEVSINAAIHGLGVGLSLLLSDASTPVPDRATPSAE